MERIYILQNRAQTVNHRAVDIVRRTRRQQDRPQTGLAGADDVPFRMIADKRGLGGLHTEELERPVERSAMWLSPAHIHAEHHRVDRIVQAKATQFLAPWGGRTSPRGVRGDGILDPS